MSDLATEKFPCPQCGDPLDGLNEDLDDPGVFVCDECDWEGRR